MREFGVTLKECYATLGLKQGADLAEIKRAYRRQAFSLHPDLNPHIKDAARRFQIINEAYVQLSQAVASGVGKGGGSSAERDEAAARTREEAKRAYSKARQGHEDKIFSDREEASGERGKEDVLKDILNDPFARRVFEDIYKHINKEDKGAEKEGGAKTASRSGPSAPYGAPRQPRGNMETLRQDAPGMLGKVKGWLRKQIDDEQVVRLPAVSLVPGACVRLEIQHGLSGRPQVIEIVLPKEFVPGKPMRLKGMGRRVGGWKGDLYVRIEPI
jgi:molecular chaperone DnaJ